MKRTLFIFLCVVGSALLVACSSDTGTNEETNDNNKEETVDEADNNNEEETADGGDLDAYGEHEIERHLSHLNYEDESDGVSIHVTDIHVGEIDIDEESKAMFQDEDTAATRGLRMTIENDNDKPVMFGKDDIRFITSADDPSLEPEPLLSDPMDEDMVIDAGDSWDGMLYFMEDGYNKAEDMDDFILTLTDALIDDEEEVEEITIDMDIDE